ncbi:hypothetical protein TYRP_011399 [Tyrophagus putrescentiae]|nr:hypothetical protein TYRP_011399 [Tyrophagus putrescentiae]
MIGNFFICDHRLYYDSQECPHFVIVKPKLSGPLLFFYYFTANVFQKWKDFEGFCVGRFLKLDTTLKLKNNNPD